MKNSLLSQNPTREQLQNQIEKHKNKVEEIQTLVNAEQEEFVSLVYFTVVQLVPNSKGMVASLQTSYHIPA